MITDTFDKSSPAIISPELFYGKHDKACDICIITFSRKALNAVLDSYDCTKIYEIHNANVTFYLLNYKGKSMAFYRTIPGSAAAVACLEEANCITGATKFIAFGSCGCLDRNLAAGKIIVPTEAYRDEGVSFHYAAPADYIQLKNAGKVAEFMHLSNIPHVKGKTWTTDAIYRETQNNMAKRRAEGCIAVEMEAAGLQAVCDFRGYELYYFLISGDMLDSPVWDSRLLGTPKETSHQLGGFRLALELALTM